MPLRKSKMMRVVSGIAMMGIIVGAKIRSIEVRAVMCAVCQKAVEIAVENQMEEEGIDNLCAPKEQHGRWLSRLDILDEPDGALHIEDMGKPGECRGECSTVARACTRALEDPDRLLSLIKAKKSKDAIVKKMCKKACADKNQNLKVNRDNDEEFVEVDDIQRAMQGGLPTGLRGMGPGMDGMPGMGGMPEDMSMQQLLESMGGMPGGSMDGDPGGMYGGQGDYPGDYSENYGGDYPPEGEYGAGSYDENGEYDSDYGEEPARYANEYGVGYDPHGGYRGGYGQNRGHQRGSYVPKGDYTGDNLIPDFGEMEGDL